VAHLAVHSTPVEGETAWIDAGRGALDSGGSRSDRSAAHRRGSLVSINAALPCSTH